MWTAITSLLSALVAPIFKLLELWGVHRAGRKQGQAEQRAADLQAGMDEARKANAARTGGRSDAELDRLLK